MHESGPSGESVAVKVSSPELQVTFVNKIAPECQEHTRIPHTADDNFLAVSQELEIPAGHDILHAVVVVDIAVVYRFDLVGTFSSNEKVMLPARHAELHEVDVACSEFISADEVYNNIHHTASPSTAGQTAQSKDKYFSSNGDLEQTSRANCKLQTANCKILAGNYSLVNILSINS